MIHVRAHAKLNLALLVGPRREDGLHELVSAVQRIDLADDLTLEEAERPSVEGFPEDTLVARALDVLDAPPLRVSITKRIPVAAGLGGGSADAGAVLAAANPLRPEPLTRDDLIRLAAEVGSDVPFFLEPGAKLVEGAGERLTALDLPRDYAVVVALPHGATKASTAEVYERFDALGGGGDFERRRDELVHALVALRAGRDLALLAPNDLAEAAGRSSLLEELSAAGAFRADVAGAGPALYGLFLRHDEAQLAARGLADRAETWVTRPVW